MHAADAIARHAETAQHGKTKAHGQLSSLQHPRAPICTSPATITPGTIAGTSALPDAQVQHMRSCAVWRHARVGKAEEAQEVEVAVAFCVCRALPQAEQLRVADVGHGGIVVVRLYGVRRLHSDAALSRPAAAALAVAAQPEVPSAE